MSAAEHRPFFQPSTSSSWEWPSTFSQFPSAQEIGGWSKVHRGLSLMFWGNLIGMIVIVTFSIATATMTPEEIAQAAGEAIAVLGSLVLIGAFVAIVLGQMLCISVPAVGRLRKAIVVALTCLLGAVFLALLGSVLLEPRLIGVAQILGIANIVFILAFLGGLGDVWGRRKLKHNSRGLLVGLFVLIVATLVVSMLIAERVDLEGIGAQGMVVEQAEVREIGPASLVLAILWLAFHLWYLVVLHQARRTVDVRRFRMLPPTPATEHGPYPPPPPAAGPPGPDRPL